MGAVFCLASFFACFLLGRHSIAAGFGAVLTAGYGYGILRANFLDNATYFLFDAAIVGFYLSCLSRLPAAWREPALGPLRSWFLVLAGWAVLMFLVPLQHPLIQLVGLRGNVFLLPFVLIGARLGSADARRLALWLAVLNFVALALAIAEYLRGVPAFYPRNAVTELIYRSNDVAGYTALRIPACFANAHCYGGTMLMTLPWLVGSWLEPRLPTWQRVLVAGGIMAAMVGIFMCAARMFVIQLAVLVLVTTLSGRLRGGSAVVWLLLLGGVGYIISGEERFQRFTTLQNTELLMSRIEGSVNLSFLELLATYPIGNGMGAGGTSIPFFLQHLLRDPVVLENEYSRILLEQGLTGLLLWTAFIVWVIRHRPRVGADAWSFGRLLMWLLCLMSFATGLIGIGLMTAIPQSPLLFAALGFAVAPQRVVPRQPRKSPAAVPPAVVAGVHVAHE
jgi:hypothetical protein